MSVLNFGELLTRFSTQNHLRINQSKSLDINFGGAEANVAAGLAQLGITSSFCSVIPNHDISLSALSVLNAYQVDTSKVIFHEGRLGVYYLEPGKGFRPSKVVYDRDYTSMSMIDPKTIDWDVVFEGVGWFNWSGISPATSENAALVCEYAIKEASKRGITISVDLNYRGKLWKYGKTPQEVMTPLMQECDVVFGGIDAPEIFFGITPEGKDTVKGIKLNDEDVVSVSEQLFKTFPKVKLFATTLRETVHATHNRLQGALFTDGKLYKSTLYDLPEIVDRVGTGDAFLAGLIAGLIKFDNNYEYIVKYATANCAWKHSVHGDFNSVTEQDVLRIIDGGSVVISR